MTQTITFALGAIHVTFVVYGDGSNPGLGVQSVNVTTKEAHPEISLGRANAQRLRQFLNDALTPEPAD